MQLQVLVIGCGLAGVTTAIALAKKGHHVTVLEAQKTISEVDSPYK
jgi:2-polyprenyl-6-methoxyphenol hydroxylase-like FAD-dependent oxidoreductase